MVLELAEAAVYTKAGIATDVVTPDNRPCKVYIARDNGTPPVYPTFDTDSARKYGERTGFTIKTSEFPVYQGTTPAQVAAGLATASYMMDYVRAVPGAPEIIFRTGRVELGTPTMSGTWTLMKDRGLRLIAIADNYKNNSMEERLAFLFDHGVKVYFVEGTNEPNLLETSTATWIAKGGTENAPGQTNPSNSVQVPPLFGDMRLLDTLMKSTSIVNKMMATQGQIVDHSTWPAASKNVYTWHSDTVASRLAAGYTPHPGTLVKKLVFHLYTNGNRPNHNGNVPGASAALPFATQHKNDLIAAYGEYPVVQTEGGYHTDITQVNAVSPEVQALYILRYFLWQLSINGLEAAIVYTMGPTPTQPDLDERDRGVFSANVKSASQGKPLHDLVQADFDGTVSPKQGADAYRNFLTLLADTDPTYAGGKMPGTITPGAGTSVVRLSNSKGESVIFFARHDTEIKTTGAVTHPAAVNSTFQYPAVLGTCNAKIYRPTYGANPTTTLNNVTSVTIPVQADVVCLVISPN